MQTIRLKLPARLTQQETTLFESLVESQAFTALREENRETGDWMLEWLCDHAPAVPDLLARLSVQAEIHEIDLGESIKFDIEDVPEDRDWLAYSYKQFPPFDVGPFFVYGSHFKGEASDALIGLQIDAATAFGSGEHGTTKGCLLAMESLHEQGVCPWNILDMGTGSGILAIAAWKLWKTPVLAVDNDEEAVRVADNHKALNQISDELQCVHGDGFDAALVKKKKPFELIIANILAGPLKEMAEDLKAVCDDNGYVILSGILEEQSQDVIDTYEAQGLTLKDHIKRDGWSTLILHNAG